MAVFLEFAGETILDPDAAVKQQEDLAFQLQQLPPADRVEFIRVLREVAGEFIRVLREVAGDWPSERERQYLLNLPEATGIA
jgi:hypothetical protein